MVIRAISFDFWNTLFTEPPGGFEFYNENRRRRLRAAVGAHAECADERIAAACAAEAARHARIWREEHRTLVTPDRVEVILTHLEVRLPEGLVAELVRHFEEGILERPPVLVPGARAALGQLAGRYRLGIISDVGFSPGRVLKEVLRGAGMLALFDSLIFSDEAGRSKPHREVFERTAQILAARPSEMVHIGDLEHTDIIGAKDAGYYAIRFTGVTPMSESEATRADRVTADFSEIPQLIQALSD